MNLRPFQIIIIGIFVAFAIGGFIFFATFRAGSGENSYGQVVVWGTLNRTAISQTIEAVRKDDEEFKLISYVQKDPRTFESELVSAIAEGRGPDLIILPDDLILTEEGRITPIPYDLIPVRTYRDTYVDGAEIFLLSEGVVGIPFAVDPMVMYWNKDLLASRGLAKPPSTWEELVSITVPAVTVRTPALAITLSALAFGEYENVENAKDIVSLLMIQAGTPIIEENSRGYRVTIDEKGDLSTSIPANAALRFYTEFANPSKNIYSWNRSLPQDRDAFLAGELGLYFGFASEYDIIAQGNPNFNFDVAEVPQGAAATLRQGLGRFHAFVIPRGARNSTGAFLVAQRLGNQKYVADLVEKLDMAPVHRSLIAAGSANPTVDVLYRSALIARSWLDPNPALSENVFKNMIEDVTSGRRSIDDSVSDAKSRLQQLFR